VEVSFIGGGKKTTLLWRINVTDKTPFFDIYMIFMLIREFEPLALRGVLDTTLCDKVCQLLGTGRWFGLVSLSDFGLPVYAVVAVIIW
jgi:hypothetical protein